MPHSHLAEGKVAASLQLGLRSIAMTMSSGLASGGKSVGGGCGGVQEKNEH